MNTRIAMIAACSGTLALAPLSAAPAAYVGALASQGLEQTAMVGAAVSRGGKPAHADLTMLVQSPASDAKQHPRSRVYPCQDFNPVKQTCGLAINQEPQWMRRTH